MVLVRLGQESCFDVLLCSFKSTDSCVSPFILALLSPSRRCFRWHTRLSRDDGDVCSHLLRGMESVDISWTMQQPLKKMMQTQRLLTSDVTAMNYNQKERSRDAQCMALAFFSWLRPLGRSMFQKFHLYWNETIESKASFDLVCYTPGNHDLWLRSRGHFPH